MVSAFSNRTIQSTVTALTVLLLTFQANGADTLSPFVSDGCSNFPEGTPSEQVLWLSCCTKHDIAYWQGGTYGDRVAADKRLRECVASVGEPEIALIMLAGVRVGGTPYLPTRFRWGYGWPYPRGYKPLSDEERAQVNKLIEQYDLEQQEMHDP